MRCVSRLLAPVLVLGGCVPAPSDLNLDKMSPEGRAVMAQRDALAEALAVDLRGVTLLDGINTNVLKLDVRSKDETLEQRVSRAQALVRYLMDKKAIPPSHYRAVVDFPVSFQVGCMPVNLYERVQVDTRAFKVVQALPAKRVLGYDQSIKGQLGEVVLDDAQWNIPFFLTVDRVELAREVMGVAAKPEEVFLSVHALWTNIGTGIATMTDDPWRLVEGAGARKGELVAILDGGDTHLARNGGRVKMEPTEPGQSREHWYVYRVPLEKLRTTPVAFARQRYAKTSAEEKTWTKAGFDLWIPLKDGHAPAAFPERGAPLSFSAEDWRATAAPPAPAHP